MNEEKLYTRYDVLMEHNGVRGKPFEELDPCIDPNYCGTCKMSPCLVSDNIVCCHRNVQYGTCEHDVIY